MSWNDFDKFEEIDEKYLPSTGEGETVATQIVTAVTKLVYKWFNDGDVYDNSYHMTGWLNDLSSYANWLYKYADGAKDILERIENVSSDDEYDKLLYDLCKCTKNFTYLQKYETQDKVGSIYDCDGPFQFTEYYEDEDEYDDWEDEEDYEDNGND